MAKAKNKFTVKSNAQNFIKYFNEVPEKTQLQIESKIPSIRTKTKRKVQSYLKKGSGVDTGIYKKSFIINNFSRNKWEVGFQVFAKKPHYRLTHLLEDGHDIWVFRKGGNRRTKWGNFGMVKIPKTTKRIEHIAPSQKFANEKVLDLYSEAISNAIERTKI